MKRTSLQPPASSPQSPPLTRIVPWSQQLACEVLQAGDLAVDLTVGKGRDTLALAQAVGATGQVVGFDILPLALDQAEAFLQSHGLDVHRWPADKTLPSQPGIYLLQACHSFLQKILQPPVKAVMANLGYLPGGDQNLITQPESTLAALRQALGSLAPGGRLAVTVYPAHPGGAEEGAAVDSCLLGLPTDEWHVLSLRVVNCCEAPYLLVAERVGK